MAAPRGASYSPKTGILAGRIFTGTPGTTQAYNRYQQARAHALGFSSYSHQRQVSKSSIFKGLVTSFTQRDNAPKTTNAQREEALRILGERQKQEIVQKGNRRYSRYVMDVDFSDHTRGGSYDMYLRRIGRRTGNEEWLPGETP